MFGRAYRASDETEASHLVLGRNVQLASYAYELYSR